MRITIFINSREIAELLNAYLLPSQIEYTERKKNPKQIKRASVTCEISLGRNGFLKDAGIEKYLKKYGPKLSKLKANYKLTDPRRLANPESQET